MKDFHPTIVSKKLIETINFYEDYFGFQAVLEKDGFAMLQSRDNPHICLSVFEANHACVADMAPVSGLVLNLPTRNVHALYDRLYMEGLEMYKELGRDMHGSRHFVVRDPNGVLINVMESLELESAFSG